MTCDKKADCHQKVCDNMCHVHMMCNKCMKPSTITRNTSITLPQKMALSKEPQTEISDILSLTKMISMKTIVPYLPDHLGMDIKVFEASEISQQFYLDTVHCVTKRKRFNIICMFDTFGEYCGMSGKEVKQKLIDELDSNVTWYTMASAACLGMHGIPFIDWLKKLKRPRIWPNELTLYVLCMNLAK